MTQPSPFPLPTPLASPFVGLPRPSGRARQRRLAQRDALWPEADTEVFQPVKGGWGQVPRTLPMIASLIDELGGREKPGRLYLALWSYDFGEGYIEVPDPARVALEAGYKAARAERTFTERMKTLRDLGFIKTQALGAREFGHVLLVDPHRVVVRIRVTAPKRIPDVWWSAFEARCSGIGIALSELSVSSPTPAGKE
jgi:hypothetical protein